jgi:hypothetical protein
MVVDRRKVRLRPFRLRRIQSWCSIVCHIASSPMYPLIYRLDASMRTGFAMNLSAM